METTVRTRTSSIIGLIRALTGDTKTFIRQEIQLAKTELSEKLSKFGKNAAILAVGGTVAYVGLFLFLIGLGWLLAYAFQAAGLQPLLASFVGFAAIGILVIALGGTLLLKGLMTIRQESLAPEKTIRTLQELKGAPENNFSESSSGDTKNVSSEEMQDRVEATEDRLGATLDELGRRLSPSHIKAQVETRIQTNPYRSGFVAMAAGLLSGLFLKRRFRHA
jgi:ElaB/YqjD/DUF883 family membrane-anchored ribosome-binding protein